MRSKSGCVSAKNRILFFVHYNKYNGLADYVVYLLQHVKRLYQKIVFISNSTLTKDDLERLNGLYDTFIQRENIGFDFGAWKDALFQEGWEALSVYDSVTLMNDTCFGPLFDLGKIYKRMEDRNDFWGLVNHRSIPIGMPGSNAPIPEHIQSYFLCFNKNVVVSSVFKQFWDAVLNEKFVNLVISKYETQLTQILANVGFLYSTCFDTSKIIKARANFSELYPDLILEERIPFLKVKSFIRDDKSTNNYICGQIKNNTKYPVALIDQYFTFFCDPNVSLNVCPKILKPYHRIQDCNKGKMKELKVAIHIHVFYLDVLEKFLQILNKISFSFDLFFTTDSLEKKYQIERKIEKMGNIFPKEITVVDDKGRDVLPWFLISKRLANYDVVGHFHTKKSKATELAGKICLEEQLALLFGQALNIINAFRKDSKIGIVIPDVPSYFQIAAPHFFYDNITFKDKFQKIWKQINCSKFVDFVSKDTLIFPYENMFWYRPKALAPFFEMDLSSTDVPPETLPIHETILHALERLPVYIAWSQGYDFRIVMPQKVSLTGFDQNKTLNRILKEQAGFIFPKASNSEKNILKFLRNNVREEILVTK